jgi:hypothetical protein
MLVSMWLWAPGRRRAGQCSAAQHEEPLLSTGALCPHSLPALVCTAPAGSPTAQMKGIAGLEDRLIGKVSRGVGLCVTLTAVNMPKLR